MSPTDGTADRSPAPAVTRALAILDLLTRSGGRALGLTEIARELHIAKSSTSNLCAALEEGGMILHEDDGFRLGRRNLELGGAYLSRFDQVREFYRITASHPVLRHELVQMAILDNTDVLYLARHEGEAPLRLSATIGDRFPASITAVGNALLSRLSNEEVRHRFSDPKTRPALTADSVTDVDGLIAKLEATRERGYSLDQGEVFPNVTGVAVVMAPMVTTGVEVALGVSMVRMSASTHHVDRVADALVSLRDQLSNPMVPSLEPAAPELSNHA